MPLVIERKTARETGCGVYFWVDKVLLATWKAKVKRDGFTFNKVITALLKYYIDENERK